MKKNTRSLRPPTPESLAKVAFTYLGRFAASEASLRRVLDNRIRRFCLHNDAFRQDADTQAELRRAIGHIIEKHRKTGALNDAAYAETKVHSLRRAGRSARAITQKLNHAGVKNDIIRNALAEDETEGGSENREMKAARELARRRKLGPFRRGEADLDRRRKDLAVLARAGFALGIARQVLEDYGDDGANCNDDGAIRESAGG